MPNLTGEPAVACRGPRARRADRRLRDRLAAACRRGLACALVVAGMLAAARGGARAQGAPQGATPQAAPERVAPERRAPGRGSPEQVSPRATRLTPLTPPAGPRAALRRDPDLRIARLKYGGGGDWYCDPSSIPNWLDDFAARTGIPAATEEAVVSLDSEDLYRYPILWVNGHGRIALSDKELAELRRYLDAGGFLWADDCYGLDASFRELAAQIYPDSPLVRLGSDHPIYRAFYDLPGLPKIHEHDGLPAQGYGLFHGGRLVVFYSFSSDIGDGLEDPDVHGDPPDVREAAAEMAVNVFVYVLTHP